LMVGLISIWKRTALSAKRSLVPVPIRNPLDLFHREIRENEMWINRLPRQRLRFVQRELQNPLMPLQHRKRLGEDCRLGVFDLRQNFLAGRPAQISECAASVSFNFIHWFVFHFAFQCM
jgi:hypothetical protein